MSKEEKAGADPNIPASEPKTYVLGIAFDLVNCQEVLDTIRLWRERGEKCYIALTNPHSVLICQRDAEMRRATEEAALTLPDGVGIIWAANILGYPHQGRVTGPALMLNLCDRGRRFGLRHYFYGGAEGVAERLARRLAEMYPGLQVAGVHCPPFRALTPEEDEEAVRRINAARPDIVWVGLGAPKQEKWMAAHAGRVEAPAMIGVGAAFDFHSGNVPWAPAWIRRLGIEWAYRLALDPRRMWRRNLDSPLFLLKVCGQCLKSFFVR